MGEVMETGNKAPTWQRVISGLLTLGIVWAFGSRVANGDLNTWLRVGSMLVALYGGYLFGDFALRGRLSGALARWSQSSKSGSGGPGSA